MKVVDISAWQSNFDWDYFVSLGVEGVIIKIGENNRLDSMFIEHVNNAVAHGLSYGVYYYTHASSYDEAVADADSVAGWITEYLNGKTPELGIWYDAEDNDMLSGDVAATCMAFLNRLTDYGHQYEGVYSSWNWMSKEGAHYLHVDAMPNYVPLWSAQYNSHDDLSDEYPGRVRIWQYTDNFYGVDGDVYYDS